MWGLLALLGCFLTAVSGQGDSSQLKCQGKYGHGEHWEEERNRIPYRCTCSISGNTASHQCVPIGCLYEGSVHRVGDTWDASNGALKCSCSATQTGTQWSCNQVPRGKGGGQVKCQGGYGHGEQWVTYRDRLPLRCTCTVTGNQWNTNCVPTGCEYEGSVYRIGEQWYTGGGTLKCQCFATQTGTQYRCEPELICKGGKADVVFVLDSSGSIRAANPADKSYDNWQLQLDFVANAVRQVSVGPDDFQFAVVSFSNNSQINFVLDQYQNKEDIINAVLSIPYMNAWTNTAAGLHTAKNQVFHQRGDRRDAQNLCIVITDGVSNINQQNTIPYANELKDEGTRMLAIGVTDQVNINELKGISSTGVEGETYWTSTDFRAINAIVQSIGRRACEEAGGLERTTTDIVCKGGKADLVFMMDSSGSIRAANPPDKSYDNWALQLGFVTDFIRKIPIGADDFRVGVVSFSNSSRVDFRLDRYYNKDDLIAAVQGIQYMDAHTNTPAGLRAVREEVFNQPGDRPDVQDICIVLTDGASNIDSQNTIPYAEDLKNDGTRVFVIGITDQIYLPELKGISSNGVEGETYWTSPSFQAIDRIVQTVASRTCEEAGGEETGWTSWGSWGACQGECGEGRQTRRRYCDGSGQCSGSSEENQPCDTGRSCTEVICRTGKADVVFMLDSSGSIRAANPADRSYDNWELELEFVANIVDRIPIGPDDFRVGVVSFSNHSSINFLLNQYSNKDDLKDAIRRIAYLDAHTNTAEGLLTVKDQVFKQSGDRPDVQNLCIVLTDGASNINPQNTIPNAQDLKADGVQVLAIGVTNQINTQELQGISSTGVEGETYWTSPDFQAINSIVGRIVTRTCSEGTGDVVIGCRHKGSVYRVGEQWITDGGAQRCRCVANQQGSHLSCERAATGYQLRCDERYAHGDQWTIRLNSLPYRCTCEITANQARYDCIPTGCRYQGHVYSVGERWDARGGRVKCSCSATSDGRSTEWQCVVEARCQDKYGDGERWTMEEQGMPLECTCTISGGQARSDCISRGCRYEGKVYRVGDEWNDRAKRFKCSCSATQRGAQWSCVPDVTCRHNQGVYRDGEEWTWYQGQMPYSCSCTVTGNVAAYKCVPAGCRYRGRIYKVGDTWTTQQGNQRLTCSCSSTGNTTQYSCH